MFVFEFKSSEKCLLKAIIITGRDITIYTSKNNAPEFLSVKSSLALKSGLAADHPFHRFLHHPTVEFSAAGSSAPHKHLIFSDELNKMEQLNNFLEFLDARQSTPQLRATDCINAIKLVEQEKKSAGDSELPSHIQEIIEGFDTNTPFFAQGEKERFLKFFQSYTENQYYLKIEAIRNFIEKLIDDNWDTLYSKRMFNETSEAEKPLVNFCETLCSLRTVLLTIDKKPLHTYLYPIAVKLIKILMENQNMPREGEIFDVINYCNSFIAKRLSIINMVIKVEISLASFLTSLIVLSWQKVPFSEAFSASMLIAAFSTPATYYLSRSLANPLSQFFIRSSNRHQEKNSYIELDEHTIGVPADMQIMSPQPWR